VTNFSSRTLAREYAFKFLYRLQLEEFVALKSSLKGSEDDSELHKSLEEFDRSYTETDEEHPDNQPTAEAKKFAQSLIKGVLINEDAIKSTVEEKLLKRKLNNLEKVDLSIILLAGYELIFDKDTPKSVVINEAINLAKKYGMEESSGFVNGVLDKVN
jgi:N utilization substance protein B